MKKILLGFAVLTLVLVGCGQEPKGLAASNITKANSYVSVSNNSAASNLQSQITTSTSKMSPGGVPGLKIVSSHLDVSPGQDASITIQTRPGNKCNIGVYYSSGLAQDSALHTKVADGTGDVTWNWKIPSTTLQGAWNVNITAGDNSILLQLQVE